MDRDGMRLDSSQEMEKHTPLKLLCRAASYQQFTCLTAFEPPSAENHYGYCSPSSSLLPLACIVFSLLSLFSVQGSGWGWLAYNKATGGLDIVTTQNQDPCSITGTIPLLGVDVWEHAYYLDYKNVRPDYLKAIWSVVNWRDVASRFEAAKKQ
ncbi:Manganese/iron superoxide dismutase [Dunaliella salina]|uniref:superoxide dismutase n=1 Tax=Dunaliella salina TaxID=3046 RepID=A0ABQ7FTV2_DUNSA|nr:Manganese/iron superoxide dismutase [Dunaliella salina]|eukprot:KAF5825853.1 Manganese/iron superoxide dismutase [Dunaliella salina]